jgi:nucleotide-binding universal stress UspA family protein
MPKFILLPVSGRASEAAAYATALAMARLFDGHLAVLHVRPDVQREIAALAAADMGMAAGLDATLSQLEQAATSREQAAEAAWRQFCAAQAITPLPRPGPAGVTTEFFKECGNEADWVGTHGRVADLIVAARSHDDGAGTLDVIEAALLETGRPVLIAPDPPSSAEPIVLDGTIGIAWKDNKQAAIAVASALPLIQRARRVLIFTVEEGQASPDRSATRLAHTLRWHNDNVAVKLLPKGSGSAASALLDAATELGCGLLVTGGYGHTRLREAVFGGFTRAILDAAPLPVLMAH